MTDSTDPSSTRVTAADLRAEETRILREVEASGFTPPDGCAGRVLTPAQAETLAQVHRDCAAGMKALDRDDVAFPATFGRAHADREYRAFRDATRPPAKAPTVADVEAAIRTACAGPADYVALAASAVAALYAPFVRDARDVETRTDATIAEISRKVREHGDQVEALGRRVESYIGFAPVSGAPTAEDFAIRFANRFTLSGRRWIAAAEAMIANGELELGGRAQRAEGALRALLADIESPGSTAIAVAAAPEDPADELVPFARDAVLAFLDEGIRLWRERRDVSGASPVDRLVARCYVDALQSSRVAIFGSTLEVAR